MIWNKSKYSEIQMFQTQRGGGGGVFQNILKVEIQNKTNSENRRLVFLIFKKEQENDGVGDISSVFQRHCQTNRLDYKQAVLYIYKVGKL